MVDDCSEVNEGVAYCRSTAIGDGELVRSGRSNAGSPLPFGVYCGVALVAARRPFPKRVDRDLAKHDSCILAQISDLSTRAFFNRYIGCFCECLQ